MPSSFPAMDPFLELNDWVSVHVHLGVEITRHLSPLVTPKYIVRAEKRYILSDESEIDVELRRPDVSVRLEHGRWPAQPSAVAIMEAPLKVSLPMPHKVSQITVEIRDVATRTLVTAIEILSLTNKRGDGRGEYLAKRGRMLFSSAHLIEIDLLRAGRRMPTIKQLPSDPYFVLLSRAESRPVADVWPIPLKSRLPAIPVPLSDGDNDVQLDLQKIMDTMYDIYGFDLEIDYESQLTPPLSIEDQTWALEQLREWRLKRIQLKK